ncbi:MAG TPA: hypothetical protein VE218_01510 [Acidobacteriaceae bacterium]|nr:hypothetical protein [Acidobacteriaceae bacterium]
MDDVPFEVLAEESANELIMRFCMRRVEQRYFAGAPSVTDLRVVDMRDPARMKDGVIEISSTAARWPKMRQVLILHELIHNALFHRFGDPDHEEGERFQAEVKRLWDAGAYKNLL